MVDAHTTETKSRRKEDLKAFALIYRRKEKQYREAAQKLEHALMELLNLEFMETLKNGECNNLSETTIIGEDE